MIDELFSKERPKLIIIFTWKLILYIVYIISIWYLLSKAIINTYSPYLAGFIWVALVVSYVISIFLIDRRE